MCVCVWFGACMCALGPFVYALPGLDGKAGLLPTACRRFNWCCCRRRSDYILKTHRTICQRVRPKPHRDIQRRASGPLAAHCCCCSCPVGADAALAAAFEATRSPGVILRSRTGRSCVQDGQRFVSKPQRWWKKIGSKSGKGKGIFFSLQKTLF